MKIVRASAGSGKTYTLAKSYIDLLMASQDQNAYRHILAVTFTNKATEEMKSRILRDLSELAKTNSRARDILIDILHDYSAFSISTIDKFFQQTLKAFSREIGQFSSYQVELDRNSLIKEAVDRILDGLTEENKELVGWLRRSVMDRVEMGQKFNIDDSLYEIGMSLKSSELSDLLHAHGLKKEDAFSKDRLELIRESCRKVEENFESRVKAAAAIVEPLLKDKVKGYLHQVVDSLTPGSDFKEPNKTLMKATAGSDFNALFGRPYGIYQTARMIERNVYSLGLATEFYNGFEALLKEKSVMPLDDSNTILKDIIDGSDAPFVYEKVGVRYDNFLLDEFQDTSSIQWANFLPLLKESESRTSGNLVVGDVKQSIYRWRNSDWTLLGTEVGKQFPNAEVETLKYNWRSQKQVVEFNNSFFRFASEKVDAENIYSDVEQGVKSKDPQPGCVRITFTDDQLAAVLNSIADVRANGAEWSDIAILVRNNKDGATIAEALIQKEIPVISDDSLSLKSSVVVRRLVSVLSFFENPEDSVGSFLAGQLHMEYPDSYHSLVDLCECILRSLMADDPDSFKGETLFVQAFMDDLQAWVDVNGNNLMLFLKHWDEKERYIGSPENSGSVRILTIHKSKGLEFPHVIFPYADKVGLFKSADHWCHVDASGSALGDAVTGVYPVKLSSDSDQTLFSDAYETEKKMQAVDNINVFYVALTRAVKSLHVISKSPSKKFKDSLDKGNPEYSSLADILFEYQDKSEDFTYGAPYDFSKMDRKPSRKEIDFPTTYSSIPIGGRLSASDDAKDFFGEDGQTGVDASNRRYGIALHAILSKVQTAEDLRAAVDEIARTGQLDADHSEAAFDLLSERIAAHPDWFSGESARNEVTVFSPDGKENRPDRVVFGRDSVIVIDYKFGERKESYKGQVRRYCRLYLDMGFKNVSGYVWYVREDEVEAI